MHPSQSVRQDKNNTESRTQTHRHVDTPVHVGRLESLIAGELHHHLGLVDRIRFIYKRKSCGVLKGSLTVSKSLLGPTLLYDVYTDRKYNLFHNLYFCTLTLLSMSGVLTLLYFNP